MNWIGWMIIGCEIAFWFILLAGLVVRYVLHKRKTGLVLLALTPLVDIVLLIITAADLHRGASATAAHALAAVYIGVSIAFGKSMIAWADTKFRQHVVKDNTAMREKLYGFAHAKHALGGWLKHVVAYVIGAALLLGLAYITGTAERSATLMSFLKLWSIVLGIDLLISISYFIWPRQKKRLQKAE